MNPTELMAAARIASGRAYCPYSKFHVGAAVLTDGGEVVPGCNVENASYGLTICAERNAIFAAVAGGMKKLTRIAVTCPDTPAGGPTSWRMPCGACRQVIAEFADENTVVDVDGVGEFKLASILPEPFSLR